MNWVGAYWACLTWPRHRALLLSWAWRAGAECAARLRDHTFLQNALQDGDMGRICSELDMLGVPLPEQEFAQAMAEFQLVR